MMKNVIEVDNFEFPYTDLRFPGENQGERILFVTRESEIIKVIRLLALTGVTLLILVLGYLIVTTIERFVPQVGVLVMLVIFLSLAVFGIGLWWVLATFKKSVFIITTRRLTKIIYTTPFTSYQFSLGLDEIEDTGSYGASFFEALFGLGFFVARSGAGAIKNFKIVNITYAKDLHNYVNKLLYSFKHFPQRINEFRPFIPNLKGEAREALFQKYPEYKTEFE